jgi:hypothetical protein
MSAAEASPPESWGVSLDSPRIRVANARAPQSTSRLIEGLGPWIPAAALLPRLGERVRVDMVSPPHPQGTGAAWPSESMVDPEMGGGRFPLVLAWPMVDRDQSWRWNSADQEISLAPYDAIAAGVRTCLPLSITETEDRRIAVVIPNHWSEQKQQKLLDSLRAEGISARLLWRPVAAAIAWTLLAERNLGEARFTSQGVGSPKLVALHLGYDGIELTVLELVERAYQGKQLVIPGRRRPPLHGYLPSGIGFRAVMQSHPFWNEQNSTPAAYEVAWRELWAKPLLTSASFAPSLELLRGESEAFARAIAPLSGVVGGQLTGSWNDLEAWRRKWALELRNLSIAGVVVTGPLKSIQVDERKSLVDWLLEGWQLSTELASIEGVDRCPDGLLAQGAAVYVAAVQTGCPSYLDTLPKLKTVVVREGKPIWKDLLPEEHEFVDGGQVWRRPQDLTGLSIAEGSHEISLALSHEEHPFVREVIARLPRAVEQQEPVSIAVAVEPAQGDARLEVKPTSPELFDRRRVVFDWKRMKELELNADEYLATVPRIFPELLLRNPSSSKWRIAAGVMQECTRIIQQPLLPRAQLRRQLLATKARLMAKDPSGYPNDSTAIGSDGIPLNNQSILDQFVRVACESLKSSSDYELDEAIVRTVSYTSTNHPAFIKHIVSKLREKRGASSQEVVTACGWCLRDPEHISLFAEVVLQRSVIATGNHYWWKALSEILRYREDATRLISSSVAEQLTQEALRLFTQQRLAGRGQMIFRCVCLVIVYLLRRRAFDDHYLEPEGQLASEVKGEFQVAIRAARSGKLRLVGGTVNLAEQLQIMIDYIDRKGKGQLQLVEE